MTPDEKLQAAEEALAAWDEAHQLESTDPGLQSMRFHETQAKRSKNLRAYLNKMGRETRERERLVDAVQAAKRDAYRAALSGAVDPSSLKGARLVRVLTHGHAQWRVVKRVNGKTVTVDGGGGGMDDPRIPHDKIIGVRS